MPFFSGMTRLIALLALVLLAGCAGGDTRTEATEAPDATEAVEIWLPESSIGYAAQQAWGLPLDREWTIEYAPRAEMPTLCGHPGQDASACTRHSLSTVYVADNLTANQESMAVLHELGHAIVGLGGGHPQDCPEAPLAGSMVMCPGGRDGPAELTAGDYDFIAAALTR